LPRGLFGIGGVAFFDRENGKGKEAIFDRELFADFIPNGKRIPDGIAS
jgi:hypothetical protein